jgi:hypothetical protein
MIFVGSASASGVAANTGPSQDSALLGAGVPRVQCGESGCAHQSGSLLELGSSAQLIKALASSTGSECATSWPSRPLATLCASRLSATPTHSAHSPSSQRPTRPGVASRDACERNEKALSERVRIGRACGILHVSPEPRQAAGERFRQQLPPLRYFSASERAPVWALGTPTWLGYPCSLCRKSA